MDYTLVCTTVFYTQLQDCYISFENYNVRYRDENYFYSRHYIF